MHMSDLSSTAPYKVDGHAHVFLRDLKMAPERGYTPEQDAPVATFLKHLDRAAFTHGVLVQPSFLGTDNSFLLETIAAHPDRLRGVAVVDPLLHVDQIAGFAKAGIVGVRLNHWKRPLPQLTKGAWPAMLRELRKHDLHVAVHCEADSLSVLVPPLLEAKLKVVIDHFGRPDAARGCADPGMFYLFGLARTRRVWVKISAWYRNGGIDRGDEVARQLMPSLMRAFGPTHLLWGSDWPHTQFKFAADQAFSAAVEKLEQLVVEKRDVDRLLGETAASFYNLHQPHQNAI
jgi:predicted TIM-barrel fold metal-dependent hydrolase